MLVEGKNPVRELFKAGTTVDKMLVEKGNFDREISQIVAIAKSNDVKVMFVERAVLDRESVTKRHQGVICYSTDFNYSSVDDILALAKERKENCLIVILDGVTDPHNLGSVIRVAECTGAHGVIIPERRSATVNETVLKVSAGAAEHMLVAKVKNVNDAIRYLKEQNVWVYAADMDGGLIYDTDLTGDVALVIGGEDTGVHDLTRKVSDGIVALPIRGKVNSLNASVAAGAVLYEAVRQRLGK